MFTFRNIEIEDVEDYWKLLNTLDVETDYMMYEPKEREQNTNIQDLRDDIETRAYLKTKQFSAI